MMTHVQAKNLFEQAAPDLTERERLVAQSIALHESSYGAGWKEGHGQGSHNFGAIMRPAGDEGPFFETGDSRPSGTAGAPAVAFTGHFKVYPDDLHGAADVVKVALKANVREAAVSGDMQGVAQGMFQNHYFTGTSQNPLVNVARYRDALLAAAAKICVETGEANPFPKLPAVPVSPQAPSPSPLPSLPVLRSASRGAAVSLLAACLERLERGHGFTPPAADFGEKLDSAVRRFQSSNGLAADGVVGPRTWATLISKLFEPGMTGY